MGLALSTSARMDRSCSCAGWIRWTRRRSAETGARREVCSSSPDGAWVGFFDGVGTLQEDRNHPAVPATTLCECGTGPRGGTWGPDGTIVMAGSDPTSELLRVSDTGGDPEVLTTPSGEQDDRDHFWPEFLPDGNAVLFTHRSRTAPSKRLRVAVLDLRTGAQKVLIQGGTHARYVPSGHLVYATGTEIARCLIRRRSDGSDRQPDAGCAASGDDGRRRGRPRHIAPMARSSYVSSTGAALARTLAWVDRSGREEPIRAPARAYTYPRICPRRDARGARHSGPGAGHLDLGLRAREPVPLHLRACGGMVSAMDAGRPPI